MKKLAAISLVLANDRGIFGWLRLDSKHCSTGRK